MNVTIPEGFAERMKAMEGLDAKALLDALDTEPSTSIRLNRRKPTDAPPYPETEPVSWCDDGRYLPTRPLFTLNPLLHAGAFYVQDASSMIHQQLTERLAKALGDEPLAILDFCAAPGGKTTAIINAVPDGSVVVANEFVAARGRILRENLEKWGYPAVITTGSSSQDYASIQDTFDIVAVDAPCSGEGMMRKEEEARRQWSPKLVTECAALQRDILSGIVNTLRPGGYLIYSTCTFNLEEDEFNSRFIHDELGLEPVAPEDLGLTGVETAGHGMTPDTSALRFMPHLTRGEGLYLSVFRKPGLHSPFLANEGRQLPTSRKGGKSKKGGRDKDSQPTPELTDRLRTWFLPEWDMQFEQNAGLITAIPAAARPLLMAIRKAGVRVTGAGLPAAEVKGRDLIPDSRVVLSTAFAKDTFPLVELSGDDALKFLRRDAIQLPPDTPKGFVGVTYSGHPLGLLKNLGNRANNLFPAPWRIRI